MKLPWEIPNLKDGDTVKVNGEPAIVHVNEDGTFELVGKQCEPSLVQRIANTLSKVSEEELS